MKLPATSETQAEKITLVVMYIACCMVVLFWFLSVIYRGVQYDLRVPRVPHYEGHSSPGSLATTIDDCYRWHSCDVAYGRSDSRPSNA